MNRPCACLFWLITLEITTVVTTRQGDMSAKRIVR